MSIASTPTFALQPSSKQVALSTNYITDFNFLNQYLPDTYEKEFERYGNRSVSSFLRMVGAEMPSMSDKIIWAEQGRLHIKYTNCTTAAVTSTPATTATFTINDTYNLPQYTPAQNVAPIGIRVGQTVAITPTAAPTGTTSAMTKGVVTAVSTGTSTPAGGGTNGTITVAFYSSFLNGNASNAFTIFIYGSEFKKGDVGMQGSLTPEDLIFDNKPIILKDKYAVSGSEMAQIGWVEVTTENGATGYLWYLKAEHETRLRFDDYLETSMIEAVPAASGSGAATQGLTGSKGVFNQVETYGNIFTGSIATLADFDSIVSRLDKQGAIEENVLFLNRESSFQIDDTLAGLNGLVVGGATQTANAASFGLFDNNRDMALNLGFSGFRRGYDFYKTDWKYLNDPTMRGGVSIAAAQVNGLLVPAGSTSVYDQIMGKNAKRPFLHVRYRASEAEDRRYKTWITGSAGGAATSDLDAMEVNFLSERCVCVLGANNFVLFKGA
jgi:hypothetical protein